MHLTNLTAIIPVNGTNLDDISFSGFPDHQKFWIPFIDHVKKDFPNAMITVMRDEDAHDGHIFYDDDNKTNAYDVLILFHNEYVTQNEYANLRQFVKNGGNIVFIDSNTFYAQVRYDRDNHKITLVSVVKQREKAYLRVGRMIVSNG
jgi:N,N-dimethylformamidase beta subunit-like protein